jgi:hypothetical protein
MITTNNRNFLRLSPIWWSCIAAALARSSGAGGKRAHVALPVSPARRSFSGRDRHHRAHGKVARHHEERVATPPRHQDDDDYTPTEDVDGSTSASESERWNPGLSSACLVWFVFGALRALGPGPWGLGPGAVGRFPFRGSGFNLSFYAVLMIMGAATNDRRAFGGQQARLCANSGDFCVKSPPRSCLRLQTQRRTTTSAPVGSQPLQLWRRTGVKLLRP